MTRGYPIQPDDIRRALERTAGTPAAESTTRDLDRLRETVKDYLKHHSGTSTHTQFLETVDKLLVAEALRLTEANQTRAAKLLGLTRPTLQAKMQKYALRRHIGVRED